MTSTILPTRQQDWGFFGTIDRIDGADASKAWALAFRAIAEATRSSPEGVRDFLDSRRGRHFADDVANGLATNHSLKDAIDAAVARWMGWRIGRRESRETGIPHGVPYLAGWVAHFEIIGEAFADD